MNSKFDRFAFIVIYKHIFHFRINPFPQKTIHSVFNISGIIILEQVSISSRRKRTASFYCLYARKNTILFREEIVFQN